MIEEMVERAASLAVEMGEDVTVTGEDGTVKGEDVTVMGEDVTATGEDVTVTGEDVTVTGEDVTVTGEDVTLTPKKRRGRPKKVLAPPQNYRRMTDFLTRKKSNMELGAGGGAVIGGGEGSRAPHNKPITSGPLREAVEICASVD